MKRVLVLGAGLVAKPLVDDLLHPHRGELLELEIGTLDVERAAGLLGGRTDRARVEALDVGDAARLSARVAAADAVVSLLPAPLHPRVARACVDRGKPLVTTSYVSDEMRALDAEARERGVLLLNECGLDPGIDHLMAVDGIRRIEASGGSVVGYSSCAGGLPAPEFNDNPWGYKLSWSPRAVLVAARSPVRYLEDGRVIEAPTPFERLPPREMEIGLDDVDGTTTLQLEVYPNRDSLPYRELYGLDRATTVFRGTLRYPGWSATCRALLDLELLSTEPGDLVGETWAELLASRLPGPMHKRVLGDEDLRREIAAHLGRPPTDPVIGRFAWLGLFSDQRLPEDASTPLDALTGAMAGPLGYGPGERDLIVLVHRFTVGTLDGRRATRHVHESRLVTTGPAGDDSAMACTVGLPAAAACRLILAGRVDLTGVRIPIDPGLVDALLAELRARGLDIEGA